MDDVKKDNLSVIDAGKADDISSQPVDYPLSPSQCTEQEQRDTKKLDDNFKKPVIGPLRRPATKPTDTGQKKGTKTVQTETPQDNAGTDEHVELAAVDRDASQLCENPKTLAVNEDKSQQSQALDDDQNHECNLEPDTLSSSSSKLQSLSPAEHAKQALTPIPYLEPKWGGRTSKYYFIEVLKSGQIMQNISLSNKSFYVFGRLPACDVCMEHPSLSRFHAVLQYCAVPNDRHEIGWYLYDLQSTHGTWINKLQVKPRVYYRVRVGHVLKFAGSSRLHILQGPDDDQEGESDLSLTELKELREKKAKLKDLDTCPDEDESKEEESSGCSWGMSEDAVDPEAENPFQEVLPQNEELYLEDPKKALKGFFEREGYDLPEYQFEEAGHGKHKCIVEVPVDSPTGQPVYAEAVVSGKRKDAVVACALEACRILDRYGLLRKKEHEARKVKTRDWEENDYYSSDEDEFLDRTGEIQKKREMRMKRAGKITEKAETYDSLIIKIDQADTEICDIENKLEQAKKDADSTEGEGMDALDAYMSAIKRGAMDAKTRMALKRRLIDLKKEKGRLQRLMDVAKPALLPGTISKPQSKLGGMFGKLGGRLKKTSEKVQIKPMVTDMHKAQTESGAAMQRGDNEVRKETESWQTKSIKKTVPQVIAEEDTKESSKDKQKVCGPGSPKTEESGSQIAISASKKASAEKRKDVSDSGSQSEAVTELVSSQNKKEHPTAPVERQAVQKRTVPRKETQAKKMKTAELSKDYCDDDPDYAVWIPPQGQTGDGRTHLNDKFGY